MKRHIPLALVVLAFGGGMYVYTSASSLLSRYLTLTLGDRTTINSLLFDPPSLTLHHFKVKNPRIYALPYALIIKDLFVKTPYVNYLKNPVNIDEITLQDVQLDIEFTNDAHTQGNWISLIKNVTVNHTTLLPRHSIIKTLNINNLTIILCLNGEDPQQLRPINITFYNLKTDKGRIIEELTELIVKKMMNEIFLKREVQDILGLPLSIFDIVKQEALDDPAH